MNWSSRTLCWQINNLRDLTNTFNHFVKKMTRNLIVENCVQKLKLIFSWQWLTKLNIWEGITKSQPRQ